MINFNIANFQKVLHEDETRFREINAKTRTYESLTDLGELQQELLEISQEIDELVGPVKTIIEEKKKSKP